LCETHDKLLPDGERAVFIQPGVELTDLLDRNAMQERHLQAAIAFHHNIQNATVRSRRGSDELRIRCGLSAAKRQEDTEEKEEKSDQTKNKRKVSFH
jgi:hypothetical protein